MFNQLPLPASYNAKRANDIFFVDASTTAAAARSFAAQHNIKPAATDKFKIAVLGIDNQIDFCHPDGALYVKGAEEDTQRYVEWVYRNLALITTQVMTLDTHETAQIFHEQFWIDQNNNHPAPFSVIMSDEVASGTWRVNPQMVNTTGVSYALLQAHALHYTNELAAKGEAPLTIWPYHCRMTSFGHALMPILDEACLFWSIARDTRTRFEVKGGNPLTENYSIFAPEVLTGPQGQPIDKRNAKLIELLMSHDAVVIGGQAASHCVAESVSDLLNEVAKQDRSLVQKIYLLEDCTSPVPAIPQVDFPAMAKAALDRFKAEGMNVVKSTDAIENWPGIQQNALATV